MSHVAGVIFGAQILTIWKSSKFGAIFWLFPGDCVSFRPKMGHKWPIFGVKTDTVEGKKPFLGKIFWRKILPAAGFGAKRPPAAAVGKKVIPLFCRRADGKPFLGKIFLTEKFFLRSPRLSGKTLGCLVSLGPKLTRWPLGETPF